MKGSILRVKFLRKIGVFRVSEGADIRFASVNSRVLNYLEGFDSRANYISNTYMLSAVHLVAGDLVVDCGANMGDLEYFFRMNHSEIGRAHV